MRLKNIIQGKSSLFEIRNMILTAISGGDKLKTAENNLLVVLYFVLKYNKKTCQGGMTFLSENN